MSGGGAQPGYGGAAGAGSYGAGVNPIIQALMQARFQGGYPQMMGQQGGYPPMMGQQGGYPQGPVMGQQPSMAASPYAAGLMAPYRGAPPWLSGQGGTPRIGPTQPMQFGMLPTGYVAPYGAAQMPQAPLPQQMTLFGQGLTPNPTLQGDAAKRFNPQLQTEAQVPAPPLMPVYNGGGEGGSAQGDGGGNQGGNADAAGPGAPGGSDTTD